MVGGEKKSLFGNNVLFFENFLLGEIYITKFTFFFSHFKCAVQYAIVQPSPPPISRTFPPTHTESVPVKQ